VTDADEKAEAVIECRLKAAFPDAIVIGEEGTHKNPGLLDAIATAELAFVVALLGDLTPWRADRRQAVEM
jgi:fructose-1,6-bisphosphatase/inositol monophosphatase family enzyme